MDAIKDVVTEVLRGLKTNKKGLAEDNPELLLRRILSKKDIGHVTFRYLRNGTLGITVDSSGWLYQLSLRKEKLLAKLNKKPFVKIKDIRFYLGDVQ